MKTKDYCRNCARCVWFNRWKCALARWEFDLWTGWCEEYTRKLKDDE